MFTDFTSLRYDENTKLIVVDGPPASGKTKICEKIAEEFGLLYMPPPTHDQMYVNPYGFDLRSLDPKMPDSCKTCDLNRFLADPTNKQVATFQMNYMFIRFEQYMNALVHVLATGQGVVLNRSIFSDTAFTESMYNAGYISKGALIGLDNIRQSIYHLFRPHLIIYLDIPPEITINNIKRRAIREEVNSKVLNTNYLADLDRVMKERVLSSLTTHSEIMIYDWSKEGNLDDIVHDIEHVDLEENPDGEKFQDWIFTDSEAMLVRLCLFHDKHKIFQEMQRCTTEKLSPELFISADDCEKQDQLMEEVVEEKYEYGWNPQMGDKYPLRKKMRNFKLSLFRRTPLDFVNCKFFDYKMYP